MAMERDNWSTTADSNTSVAGINIAENCDPGNLNQSDRAIMAALANHAEVTVASAATTNILGADSEKVAISGTTTITSLGTGTNRVRFVRFTGSLTLTHHASLILPGGANIVTAAGDTMIVVSDASSNARVLAYQSVWSRFSAHKNGTNQTISAVTDTKVTFSAERFDRGSHFASSTWTPPAGDILIGGMVSFDTTNITDGILMQLHIYKNGASFARAYQYAAHDTKAQSLDVTTADTANGTDTYELYAYGGGTGNKTILGTTTDTYFWGHRL